MSFKLPKHSLSKSDFKLAKECATKLYYKKTKLPNTLNENEYMMMLAQGGYMVGLMAQLYYPDGIEIKTESGSQYAIEETNELLKREKVILFEPAIYSDHKLIRIDILTKDGNHFDLIEVKSKSYNSDKHENLFNSKGEIEREFKPYVEDVAYQTMVLQEVFPDADITPYLMMPDKAKTTSIDNLIGQFSIKESESSTESFKAYDVSFSGDPEELRQDEILTLVNVQKEVEFIKEYVKSSSNRFIVSLKPDLTKIQEELTTKCKKCEYNDSNPEQSGFHQCWGDLALPDPHVFDLFHMGSLRGNGGPYVNTMIKMGKTSLYDLPISQLGDGPRGIQQKRQIEYTKNNQEYIDPELKNIIQSWEYPLHFIDFEGSTMAIPYHKGLRPYENVAFQWSCHTVHKPGEEPKHYEWINVDDTMPNFRFAESLMDHVGANGTVFMWYPYENRVLKHVFEQMEDHGHDNPDLFNWLSLMVKFKDDEDYTMVDLWKLSNLHYYHPDMKGSWSIKSVLPAIWNNNPYLWKVPFLQKYVKLVNGKAIDPYKALPEFDIPGSKGVVRGGTDAVKAYQEMMYGAYGSAPEIKDMWRELLLRYCELDTMAMVIIWKHWCHSLNINLNTGS